MNLRPWDTHPKDRRTDDNQVVRRDTAGGPPGTIRHGEASPHGRGDRRIIYVRLTEAGRAMIDLLAQPLVEAHQSTKGNFDRTSLELLNTLLFELRNSRDKNF